MSGPAYSAGLIGKDVAPTAVVKCHSHHRPRSEGRGGEEVSEVKQSWPSPSVPGRPGRSVCGRWVREEKGRGTLSWRRRGEEMWRAAIWSGGASGM